jgi:hypothetical protein
VTPILLLEINEVPWRLLDRYGADPAFPHLRRFLADARQYTSVAVDTGELSPWVTWPTFHRGINNERHGIKNLGQDPATYGGVPIWEEIRKRGGSIGVFGSMQSWPPQDPGPGGFYVPDTFAHDERCEPAALSRLQAFNLQQVRRNARVVDRAMPSIGEALSLLSDFRHAGVRWSTLARLAMQVLAERFDSTRAARRPIFQGVLFWDVFRKHFDARNPPAFSTFFTNHIAGVMHRYWKDLFPEDFPGEAIDPSRDRLMRFALGVLDDMLADVERWRRENPALVVVFAASMGQDAVHRDYHEGFELVVEDLALLMQAAGLGREDYKALIAMVPQVAVEVPDAAKRAWARATLEKAVCGTVPFIRVQEIGASLSITVTTPPLAQMEHGGIVIGNAALSWAACGIRKQEVEPGTAYHIPEGSFAVVAQGVAPDAGRARVDADRVKAWLLSVSESGASRVASLA